MFSSVLSDNEQLVNMADENLIRRYTPLSCSCLRLDAVLPKLGQSLLSECLGKLLREI